VAEPTPGARLGRCRRALASGLLVGLLVAAGQASAGIAPLPADPADAGRTTLAGLEAAARETAHDRLVERHARLLRAAAVALADAGGAELRLRRLALDLGRLERERAAGVALVDARAAELALRQRRLEGLLAEIVQLSRDEAGDPRRLAQLRAVAAAFAQPFAEARQALAQGRTAVATLDERIAALRRAAVTARQALVEAEARRAWLAADIDRTVAAATEAAARATAAGRGAALAAERLARATAARRLPTLPLPAAGPATVAAASPTASPGEVLRIAAPALTARAVALDRPARSLAHFDLSPPMPPAPGLAGGGHVMPVAGAVIGRFGDGQRAPFDRGLTIEVTDRRLVRAPRDGRVVFARDYEGFGLLLIIDHGNEYHSLLSGLSRFVVHEGWAVRAGQMVGTLEPGSEAVGRLYVELRRRGVPVDPLAWFAAGQDKVRS
jgi:murein DD-endopeptidase MepM/ murein hydrolase activator NlpD